MLEKSAKIYIAGHRGMVGSALVRQLERLGYKNLLRRTHKELDLCNQAEVRAFMNNEKPDYVILAAAKVGGIHANNKYPAEFIYQNLMMEANVINAAHQANCHNLLFLGSSCIYPKFAEQPMSETALLTDTLEPTNEPYAIAKIAGIKLCESYNRQYGTDYRSVMPTNLYGPNDNFHPENSHVIPALLRRFHEASIQSNSTITCWGTGQAKREFLHVDDMADACIHIMNLDITSYQKHTQPTLSHINVGTGIDITIQQLVETISTITSFSGEIYWDKSKPDGAPRKLLDCSRMKSLGWEAKHTLKSGLLNTYNWYKKNLKDIRR